LAEEYAEVLARYVSPDAPDQGAEAAD
jgi:hypothetical protein